MGFSLAELHFVQCLYDCRGKADFSGALYNLTTLCLNGTLSCVDFMDVIMEDIPFPGVPGIFLRFLSCVLENCLD